MHAAAGRFQDRPHEGDSRALAVRPRHMDDPRQFLLRMAERSKQAPHPIERQVDPLRMKREQARHDGIDQVHDALDYSINPGAPMTLASFPEHLCLWRNTTRLQWNKRYRFAGTGRFSTTAASGAGAGGVGGVLVNSRHRLDSVARS